MKELALTLPGTSGGRIYNPPLNFPASTTTLADVVNLALQIGLYIGGALMFFWAVWGVFDYIRAEGNKENLGKARKKIQWAIVGFIILILTFFVADYVQFLLARTGGTYRPIKSLTF